MATGIVFKVWRTLQNLNFVHPPDPPPLKVLALALLLFCFQSAKAQERILPEKDSLEVSLKRYYNELWTAEREAFIYRQKGEWMNYVPSLGFTLGLPSVSYSTQTLFSHLENKKARKAALQSIDRKYTLMYNEELNRLRIEYEKIQLQKYKLLVQEQALETERKIFAIHQEAYNKKELKPLEYLQRLKQIESIEQGIQIARQDHSINILELFKLAHYGIPAQALYFDDQQDCILLAREKQ